MKNYRDWDHDSGIVAYEINDESILIKFRKGNTYKYTGGNIGGSNLSEMKRLAELGEGLNAFINTHPGVKKGAIRIK